MKYLTEQGAYVLIIWFFVFMGCSVALALKKDETLGLGKSVLVQFAAFCFGSLLLTAFFLGANWNRWIVWLMGMPAGLIAAKGLKLLFEKFDKLDDFWDFIANVRKGYDIAKGGSTTNKEDEQKPGN